MYRLVRIAVAIGTYVILPVGALLLAGAAYMYHDTRG